MNLPTRISGTIEFPFENPLMYPERARLNQNQDPEVGGNLAVPVKEQRENVQRGRPDCFPVSFQVGWFPSNYVEEDYSEYC